MPSLDVELVSRSVHTDARRARVHRTYTHSRVHCHRVELFTEHAKNTFAAQNKRQDVDRTQAYFCRGLAKGRWIEEADELSVFYGGTG